MAKRKFNKEQLEETVNTSTTIKEVLVKLGISTKGGCYKAIYRAAKNFNVDISELIKSNSENVVSRKRNFNKEHFIDAVSTSSTIKEVLIKLGINTIGGCYKQFYRAAKAFEVDISKFVYACRPETEAAKRKLITDDQVIKLVKVNFSFESIKRELGLKVDTGANNNWIRNKIKDLNLDTSHFTGQAHLKGKKHNFNKKIPLENVLIKHSTYSRGTLKWRLIKEDKLISECALCKIAEWKGIKLILVLDHINGVNNDNRLENLRLLCPNCNSQTDTFCGRNKAIKNAQKKLIQFNNE
jgi:hypothetical protein